MERRKEEIRRKWIWWYVGKMNIINWRSNKERKRCEWIKKKVKKIIKEYGEGIWRECYDGILRKKKLGLMKN